MKVGDHSFDNTADTRPPLYWDEEDQLFKRDYSRGHWVEDQPSTTEYAVDRGEGSES